MNKKLSAKKEEDILNAIYRERRRKRKLALSFDESIERAVRIIKRREKKAGAATGAGDVLHNRRALFNSRRLCGVRVG